MNVEGANSQEIPLRDAACDLADRIWRKVRVALRFHGKGTFPNFPIPMRLPFGSWWLAWNDAVGKAVLKGAYEKAECDVVLRLLQPGMTVLDIGAHHGYYTLLASYRVGQSGRVLAFEPSPRERRKLRWHLRWNHCSNVEVVEMALGAQAGEAELFLVAGRETGCNSLRPPAVRGTPKKLGVPIGTLDGFVSRRGIERVDFLKLDVEGAELSVLEGGQQLLSRRPRLIALVEVSGQRTAAWGYAPEEILKLLAARGFQWFEPCEGGWLRPAALTAPSYNGNLVAVPEERLEEVRMLLAPPERV
jgi:FkbM family methyltransferase